MEDDLLDSRVIRAILFDLDGTLRHSRPHYNEAFAAIATRLGLAVTPEDRRRGGRWLHYYWAKSDELVADRSQYADDPEAFWTNHVRWVLIALGCDPQQSARLAPQAYQLMNDEFKPQDWVPPDIPPALQTLKNAGYRLAVLSNRSKPFQDQLETLELDSYFEFAHHAGEIEAWKPDPEIFQRALEAMGSRPGETVYVGDNYFADVVGARSAGLIPVLVDPEGLFPEADCVVIRCIGELPGLLRA
jgi:putative hydrolase of the HAD superfamily